MGDGAAPVDVGLPNRASHWLGSSFRNASALYVFAGLVVLFALWIPETFLTTTTWRTLLGQQAITALVAVGLCLPLAAGVFDLSVGTAVGAGMTMSAWLIGVQHVPVPVAVLAVLAAGVGIGLANAFLVLALGIDSFIATLGMASILTSVVLAVSQGQLIIGLSTSFQALGTTQIVGVTLPFFVMLLIATALWYVLERTPAGRRFYATGGNREAARLAGVRTSRVILVSLVACSLISTLAGILLAAGLGAGDPSLGPDYLLPAFSAAFLGSTQFRNGRFNVWGTVISIYVLATGTKGLQLAGAPFWIPALFNGLSLIVAVALTRSHSGVFRSFRIGRPRRAGTSSGR
jgi:ribose transport system permease protein